MPGTILKTKLLSLGASAYLGAYAIAAPKDIQIILRLFLVIAMYCQGSSSQIKTFTEPSTLLAGWEGSVGTCGR